MFVDDLILVSNASKRTTMNRLLYLNIYKDLIGQKPNLNKSANFLLSQCNTKIVKAIYLQEFEDQVGPISLYLSWYSYFYKETSG